MMEVWDDILNSESFNTYRHPGGEESGGGWVASRNGRVGKKSNRGGKAERGGVCKGGFSEDVLRSESRIENVKSSLCAFLLREWHKELNLQMNFKR